MRKSFEVQPVPEGGGRKKGEEMPEGVLEPHGKEREEESKKREQSLSKARERFASLELDAAEQLKNFKKSGEKKSIEEIKGYKETKEKYLGALQSRRAKLYEKTLDEIEKMGLSKKEAGELMRQKMEEIIKETVVAEANNLYDAKTRLALEAKGDANFAEKAWKTAGQAVELYRKLPLKYKLMVSGGLLACGVAAGAAGGATGAALLTGVFVGRRIQTVFGGAATAVGLEGLIKRLQEKRAEKETFEDFGDKLSKLIKNNDKNLDKRLFELEGKKKSEKTKRYILAGTAGVVVASGLLGRAIRWGIQEIQGKPIKEVAAGLLGQRPPASGVSPESGVSYETAKGGPEMAAKGDSVWKIISRQMSERYGEKFNNLDEARKTYLIDALKDKVTADPEKFSLTNTEQIQAGQTYDFLPGSQAEIEEAFNAAKTIKENVAVQILEHNKAIEDWVKSHPGQSLTSEKIDEILGGGKPEIAEMEESGETGGAEPAPETDELESGAKEVMDYNERAQIRAIGYDQTEYQSVKNMRIDDFLRKFRPRNQAWDLWRSNPDYYNDYGPFEFRHHLRAAEIIRGYHDHYHYQRAGEIIRGPFPHYRYERAGEIIRGRYPRYGMGDMTVGRFFQMYGPRRFPFPSPPLPPPPPIPRPF